MAERSISIRVPGTSANCGPGFDTLGLACTLYNDLTLELTHEPQLEIVVHGAGAGAIPTDARNIVWRSIQYLLQQAGAEREYRGAKIEMENRVPISRGLGSSATAIVAGLKAANVLIGNRYSRRELLQFAAAIEGHPDNVAPAIFGGFTISTTMRSGVECFSFVPKFHLTFVVAVPDFTLPTRAARKVLPEDVPMKDAVFNIGRATMLIAALTRGSERFLRASFDDALHQPYRSKLVPGMYDVFRAARRAGAVGTSLSGAGPSLIAYALEHHRCEEAIGEAMKSAFAAHDVHADILTLRLDMRGAHVRKE